jgi:hypothetical protein
MNARVQLRVRRRARCSPISAFGLEVAAGQLLDVAQLVVRTRAPVAGISIRPDVIFAGSLLAGMFPAYERTAHRRIAELSDPV